MFFRRKKKAPAAEAAPGPGAASGDPSEGRVPTNATTQFLTGEASKDRRNVQILLEAIAGLSESRDLDSLLTDIVDRSIEITGAERGLLLLRPAKNAEASDGALQLRVGRLRGGKPIGDDLRFSTSIAAKVLNEVQALRATVHSESEALELGRSVYDLKLRAVMCVPLAATRGEEGATSSEQPNGVLYVDSRAATRQFSQGDLALFAALAQHISIAIENARLHFDSLEKVRLEQSLELASVIQRDLMPGVPTDLDGWEVHGWYGPAEQTAGDFYDFVKMRDGKLAIAVGDVTGHGIGPALLSSSAQASMRSYLRLISDPGEVVTLLNQDLCERAEDGRFLTLFMAMLEVDGKMIGLNAGHALPFIWRVATREVETISGGGPALGMIPDEPYEAHAPIQFDSGDVLVLYTDGLTEARDPNDHDNMYGEEGLIKSLGDKAGEGSSKDICIGLVEEAMQLTGGLREDDITVVVVKKL